MRLNYFLAVVLVIFSVSFGDVFPKETITKKQVTSSMSDVICMAQNPRDSLVYVVSWCGNSQNKTILLVFDKDINLVDSIIFDSNGDSLLWIKSIFIDDSTTFFIGWAIYQLEAGKLCKKNIGRGGEMTCFDNKYYLATDSGVKSFDKDLVLLNYEKMEGDFFGIASSDSSLCAISRKADEVIIASFTTSWSTVSSKDGYLVGLFQHDIGGKIFYRTPTSIVFEGSFFINGSPGLLIKRTEKKWETCGSSFENISLVKKMTIDQNGNVFGTSFDMVVKFNLETKNVSKFWYSENDFPTRWSLGHCSSSFDNVLYFASVGVIIKYNPNPTKIISDFGVKLYTQKSGVGKFLGVYNVKGRLLTRSQDYKNKLPAGLYFLKIQSSFQSSFQKIIIK